MPKTNIKFCIIINISKINGLYEKHEGNCSLTAPQTNIKSMNKK